MNFDSKPNQVAHKQNMEKLQPKNDFQSLNESVLTMSMYREELVSVLDIPYEESEVIQETVRTYAKQIPKSPIKRNLNINLGNSQEKSTKDFNFTDQNTVLKNIANNNNSSNNKNNNIMSNSTKKFCKEVGDEYDQVNISPRQIKKQGKVNKFIQLNENVEPKPGIHALQKQINSRVFDDRDDYMNTLQSISPRNDQILHTQSQERSFVSQISYYSYTQPYNQYDKENTHSGYISYSNIRPKKSLLNSFQRISQKWLVNTKQLYNETFNNRKRCKCDINLTEGETCSQAIAWLKQQYRNNDFSKMKEQYKSLLQMKDIYQQYKHQIDLDAVRTYPSSGLFHEGAPLCQSLKNILYAFSVYDIQVGNQQLRHKKQLNKLHSFCQNSSILLIKNKQSIFIIY